LINRAAWREGDDVMPDDTYADVVEVIIGKIRDVPLLLRQRMTLVAAAAGVEEFSATLG